MSQVPYIAIDEPVNNLQINDMTFTGTGTVVAPFYMIEITGYSKFSDFADDEHLFCSVLPLFDGQYWCFYFKGNLLQDKSQTDNPYYYQNEVISDGTDFTFYYITVRKPLRISNINLWNKQMPYTYASRQVRTGVIDGVPILEEMNDSDVFYGFDNQVKPLSLYELQCMNCDTRNTIYQTNQMIFNGNFILKDDGTYTNVYVNDNGDVVPCDKGDENNGE